MVKPFREANEEKRTIQIMIELYCKKSHGTKYELCEDCKDLLEYAQRRLDICKFRDNKGTCGKCKAHCYRPDMRERIVKVMRFSGPRMLYLHPVLTFRHLVKGLYK